MVHSLARRMFDASQADELTQDVFVRAWQKLATFRAEASFGAWLRRLATNLAINRACSLQRDRHAPTSDELGATRDAPAGTRLDLEAALGRLPARARAAFVLHDVEGHTHDEIGRLLGVEAGTSKSQLHRARMLLRAALDSSKNERLARELLDEGRRFMALGPRKCSPSSTTPRNGCLAWQRSRCVWRQSASELVPRCGWRASGSISS